MDIFEVLTNGFHYLILILHHLTCCIGVILNSCKYIKKHIHLPNPFFSCKCTGIDLLRSFGCCPYQLGDDLTDITGSGRRLLCQLSDLICNNRKSTSGFTSSRSLDGGVKRQEIRLSCNGIDLREDPTDLIHLAHQRIRRFLGRANRHCHTTKRLLYIHSFIVTFFHSIMNCMEALFYLLGHLVVAVDLLSRFCNLLIYRNG